MSRRVLLLINRSKPEVVAALPGVRAAVASGGGRIVAELDAHHEPTPVEDGKDVDLVVVLGGDGTLLSQSHRCVSLSVPLLGVNLGRLGFMAEFDLSAMEEQARELFGSAPLMLTDRAMLDVRVLRGRALCAKPSLALNDAVITAGPPYRMIAIGIAFDGSAGPAVMGDGIIVSTAIGSTAYNVSAGGPIIAPEVDGVVVTPMAAHTLAFRPVVVPGKSTIELTLLRVNEDHGDGTSGTTLVLDGRVHATLKQGDRVTISRHDRPVRFVRNPRGNYWATLIEKMQWGVPPKLRNG